MSPTNEQAAPPPLRRTTFVGRTQEIAQLCALLASGVPLITLVGPGGVGKTRLAGEVVQADVIGRLGFEDICWIDLAPLTAVEALPHALARASGVEEVGADALTVVSALRDRRLLLVLDNCEHLTVAVAIFVDRLLARCPEVRVLATSREPLRVEGERVWRVPALSLPTAEASPTVNSALEAEAVQLFIDRAALAGARLVISDETAPTVVELCRRLDGLPLAVELAAARLPALSVRDLLARLSDRLDLLATGPHTAPPRQRTLRALLSWSEALLDEDERRVLRRAAIFVGSFDAGAIEAVSGAGALKPLLRLVDKSLVVSETSDGGRTRFRLLETVRQYARDSLADSGEMETTSRAHAHYFVCAAELASRHYTGAEQVLWLDALETDVENIRVALEHCASAGDAEAGLRLAVALKQLWNVRGYRDEGRRWLQRLLDLPASRTADLRPLRSRALADAGMFSWMGRDAAAAQVCYDEAASVYTSLGDRVGLADTWRGRALVLLLARRLHEARALLGESLAVFRAAGDRWLTALSLEHHALLAVVSARPEEARAPLDEAIPLLRELGELSVLQTALSFRGRLDWLRGDRDAAARYLEESLALARQLGYKVQISITATFLGLLAVAGDDHEAARTHLGTVVRAAREWGLRRAGLAAALDGLAAVAVTRGDTDDARSLLGAAAHLRDIEPFADAMAGMRDWLARVDVIRRNAALPAPAPVEVEDGITLALRVVARPSQSGLRVPPGSAATAPGALASLTQREVAVLRHLAAGRTDRQIAAHLVIAESTVGRHLANIFGKLGVTSRVAAATLALREGLA
jgi:predicted ATPase/DNA-binding CsgD family transcriptional regulator